MKTLLEKMVFKAGIREYFMSMQENTSAGGDSVMVKMNVMVLKERWREWKRRRG